VVLVGAGPGRPDLVTVRGKEWIQRADVIYYDRLVDPAILRWAKRSCVCVYVGRERGRAAVGHEEVVVRMIDEARRGRRVVRLKGGDPLLFGRGGEEALALAEAGIPFEIVPGVTAALGAAAYTGVPLTHRGLASSVLILTGHGAGEPPPEPTVVVYMAAGSLARVVADLRRAGRAGATPALAVEWATWPVQRTVVSTLGDIAAAVRRAGLGPPLLLVVGEVVRLHARLGWYRGRVPDVAEVGR
jgi:uroporphyrin-III C-methyltransferase